MGPLSGHISPSRFTHCSVNLSLSLVHLPSLSFRNFSAKPGDFRAANQLPFALLPDAAVTTCIFIPWMWWSDNLKPGVQLPSWRICPMTNHGWWCFIHSIYKFMADFWSQSSKVFSIVLGLRSWRMKSHSAGKLHYLLFIGGQISHAMLDYPVRKNCSHICCTWILNIHFSSHCKYGPFVYHGPF